MPYQKKDPSEEGPKQKINIRLREALWFYAGTHNMSATAFIEQLIREHIEANRPDFLTKWNITQRGHPDD